MNRVDEFIEEYKKLEEAVRRVYRLSRDQSVIAELKQQRRFESRKAEIQSCADLRNYLQHNSRLNHEYAAIPTEAAISFLRELTAMVNDRPRCRDICVPMQDIIWRGMEDPVKEAMQIMREEGHSSIPILCGGIVTGVFDERSLFRYVSQTDGNVFRDGSLTFRDLLPYVSVNERNMQTFAFAGMNTYVDDIIELFERKLENGKRIRLVLLTDSGRQLDQLQGILTPWDIIAAAND